MSVHVTRRAFIAGSAVGLSSLTSARRASAQPKITITYWNGLTGADGKVMDELIDRFTAQTGIRIEQQRLPWAVVVFLGTVWHRGGANAADRPRLGITPQYCQPWARQLENMVLAVPQDVAATYPRRVQELLGYSIHPPLMGYVNGMHPARLIDPEYGKRDRVEARRAAEIFDRRR